MIAVSSLVEAAGLCTTVCIVLDPGPWSPQLGREDHQVRTLPQPGIPLRRTKQDRVRSETFILCLSLLPHGSQLSIRVRMLVCHAGLLQGTVHTCAQALAFLILLPSPRPGS